MDDDAYIAGYEIGIFAGRKEVISWLVTHRPLEGYLSDYVVSPSELKSKLEEWDMEEE